MSAFSYHRFMLLLACIDCSKVDNRLISECTVKAAMKVQCLCVSTSKKALLSGFLVSIRFFVVCVRRN